MLLSDFFDRVYFPRRLRGKSENSVRLYRLTIRQFTRTLGRPPAVADLTEENVLQHLSRRCDVAPATRNKELAQLTALWRLACQRAILQVWPDIRDEHEPERAPIAWLPDELTRLIRSAAETPGLIGDVPAGLWWDAFVRVTLDTGERVNCVRQACWGWLQGEWMCVPAEARKGKVRDRRYRLSPDTQASLAILRQHAIGSAVFPWPLCASYLWSKYREIVARAGLPTGRKYQLHCLRKTVASAVHAAGLDPQEALDHSDRRTTQRYLDPRFTRERQPCDILAEYLRNPRRRDPPDQRATG